MQKLFTFGGSSKNSATDCNAKGSIANNASNRADCAEEDLSHEQYLARNNSASEMDEDDLEGELNLSDDGSN